MADAFSAGIPLCTILYPTAGFCKCLRLGFMAHRNRRPLLNSARLGLVLLQKVAQGIVVLLVTIVYCALILFFSPPFQILEEIKAGRCVGEIGMPETAGSASRGGSDG